MTFDPNQIHGNLVKLGEEWSDKEAAASLLDTHRSYRHCLRMAKAPHNQLLVKRFDRLLVFAYLAGTKSTKGRWKCRCDCVAITLVPTNDLKSQHTTSCGCRRDELIQTRAITHGATANGLTQKEFWVWCSMRARCNSKSSTDYKDYGARGIFVCKRWNKYEHFIADMGLRPSPRHTLERRRNNRGYSPGNCYWATRRQQAHNTRNTKLSHAIARTIRQKRALGHRITDVSKALGLSRSTVGTVWYEIGWKA